MNNCITCGKATEYDWCSDECRKCINCGVKLETNDDLKCVICSFGGG